MTITHKDRFNGSCISNNGRIYLFKIYDKNWSGATTEISAGSGGIKIKYDTSGQEKFSPIIASKCTISLVVDTTISGQWLEQFITSLRETYEEGDVTLVIWNNSNISNEPLWSGNVTIDLSAKEDVSKPYEIELTATDGIGLLKNYDMVETQGTNPYDESDTYISDGYQTFIYWIKTILAYCNTPDSDSTDGDVGDYTFSTAIDWWYEDHPSPDINTCPLAYTQAQMLGSYELKENGTYKVTNVYKVLESICKMWGMRVVFWKNRFWFTQVELYNTADTGTLAVPDNVDSQIWTKAGVFSSSQDYLGDTWFSLYSQAIETNAGGFKGGLQKLEGSKWDYYPKLKEVSVDFESISNNNYFQTFPQPTTSTTSYIDLITSSPIATITGASGLGGFNISIVLEFNSSWGFGGDYCDIYWGVRAKPSGDPNFLNGYYISNVANNPTSWTAWPSLSTNAFYSLGAGYPIHDCWLFMLDLFTLNSAAQWPTSIIPGGISQQIFSCVIPSDSNFTGDWDFEFFTYACKMPYGGGSSGTPAYYIGHMGTNHLGGWLGSQIPYITYSDVYDANGKPLSQFNPIVNSVIGGSLSQTSVYSSRSETQKQEVKDIWWGDTPTIAQPESLRYDNGAGTVGYTEPSGLWRNGQTGTFNKTLSELLGEARLFNQQQSDYKWSLVTAVSEENRSKDDGTAVRPVYINPVGRIQDTVEEVFYYMRRGSFNVLWDEWQAEWLEVSLDNSISTTTTTTTTGGSTPSGSSSAKLAAPNPDDSLSYLERSTILTTLSADLAAGTITFYEFTASGDVGDTDTTISVESTDTVVPINKGAAILTNARDLYKQYQHKDRGTIAGFTVDSDGIAKGGIEITDWLDSDTMEGASDTSLPTSESVKAYVDSQVGASDTLQEVCDNGNTTTTDIMIGSSIGTLALSDQTTTKLYMNTNQIRLYAGGLEMFNAYNASQDGVIIGNLTGDNDITLAGGSGKTLFLQGSDGNVGIGTTAPGRKLTISSTDNLVFLDSSSNAYLTIDRSATDRRSALVFSTAGDGTSNIPNNINWAMGSADSDEVGDGTGFFIGTNTNATSSKLFIEQGGNVGIGTTAPSSYAGTADNLVVNGGAADSGITIATTSSYIGNLYFADGTTGAERYAGLIQYQHSTDMMKFGTAGATNKMVIDSSGNVGIGTTTPDLKLEVFEGYIKIGDSSNTGYGIQLERNSATVGFINTANNRINIQAQNSNDVELRDTSGSGLIVKDGGSVGIGTTSPDAKLQVNGDINALGFMNEEGGNMNRLLFPKGGAYNGGHPLTGAIKVTLPVLWTNTMMRITLRVFDYSQNESFDVTIAGYNYTGEYWVNTSAWISSQSDKDRNFSVRFGNDGTNTLFYIGELTSTWSYLKVNIIDVELNHAGTVDDWSTANWAIGLEASAFENINQTRSDTQVNNWKRNNQDLYYGSGTGSVGIGTTSPLSELHIKNGSAISAAYNDAQLIIEGSDKSVLQMATSTTGYSMLVFGDTDDGNRGGIFYYNNGDYMNIEVNNSEVIRINSSLNVGIGTTSPASELHVNGAATLTAMAAPSDPTTNDCVIWLDSTTLDLMVKITGESSTVTRVIASFEE